MKKFLPIIVSVFIVFLIVICISKSMTKPDVHAKETPKEMILAHNQSTDHPVHKSLTIFKKRLEEVSDGQLQVKIYPNGQLGSEREAIEMTQTNAIQMTKVSASALESFSPSYSLFSTPYLFDDMESFRYVMKQEDTQKQFFNSTLDNGFIGITYYDAGMRNLYTKDKVIKDSSDMDGLKVRVQPSKTSVSLIDSIGGTPTPMDYGEVYTALQSGVIDAAENNETALTTNNHGEVAKYYYRTEHAFVPDILIMNRETYQSLTDEQRQWIKEASAYSTSKHEKIWDKEIAQMRKKAKNEMGVQFKDVDKQSFKEASKSLRESFAKNPDTKPYYETINKEKMRYEKNKNRH